MDGRSLNDQVIPRRKAAKAAAASFTEQLASSSESDSDGNYMRTKRTVPSSIARKKNKGIKADSVAVEGVSTALDTTLLSTPSKILSGSHTPRPRPRPIPKKFEAKNTESEEKNKGVPDSPSRLKGLLPAEASSSQGSVSAHTVSVLASPRKKRKQDMQETEQAWEEAAKDMHSQEIEDASSDDLPDVEEAFNFAHLRRSSASGAANTTSQVKSNVKRKFQYDSENDTPAVWVPAPPDDSIKIPGEIVFARDGPNAISYWPALVQQYVPPKTPKQKHGKYTVVFLDTTRKDIPRPWFYTTDQDEFATCKLGAFESFHQDVLNDDEDEAPHNPNATNGCTQHSPSPIPSDHLPSTVDFVNLGIREQFAYTKPVLIAILNEKYSPARRKHDLFISGGQGRQAVVDDAVLRGKMEPQTVSELQKYLSRWCLRDDQRAQFMDDNGQLTTEFSESTTLPRSRSTDTQVEIDNGSQRSVSPLGSECEVPPSSFTPRTERASSVENGLTASDSSQVLLTNSTATLPTTISDGVEGSSYNAAQMDTDVHSGSQISASLPRQRGCAAFEALAGVEKVDYCINVLLPEAILQILLWRTGNRRSVELLSEHEEEDLHKQGEELLRETDFVFDAMRLRDLKSRNFGGRVPKGKSDNTAGRASLRTKRNSVNYQQ